MSYAIKTVAELTGIPRNTLLAWERRYDLIEPRRSDNGYRVYSDEDVALLKRVKALTDEGHRISEAVRLVNRDPLGDVQPKAAASADEAAAALRDAIQERLLDFDRAGAERILQRTVLMSFPTLLDTIYSPLMIELGDLWHSGQVSVAQEHFASSFCKEKLMTMLNALSHGATNSRDVFCAGYEGEYHELGLLAISIKLAMHGFRVFYLGPNLPTDELVRTVQQNRPELVCQSLVLSRESAQAHRYARTLRAELPPETTLALGGPGLAGVADPGIPGVHFCVSIDELMVRMAKP